MTEAQKKELKKIEKAVVATAKKMRTKIEKENKKLKKNDAYLLKDYDPTGRVGDWESWWATKTLDVRYTITIEIKSKNGKYDYEGSPCHTTCNLNILKSWINDLITDLYSKGSKIMEVSLEVSFMQHRKSLMPDQDGDEVANYLVSEIEEKLKPPWKYGDLKIKLEQHFFVEGTDTSKSK